jgi:chromosome segregation ATPase
MQLRLYRVALQTVLGARAVDTARGSTLADLIQKTAKDRRATVTLTLTNEGPEGEISCT